LILSVTSRGPPSNRDIAPTARGGRHALEWRSVDGYLVETARACSSSGFCPETYVRRQGVGVLRVGSKPIKYDLERTDTDLA
jgi:hypothetical protein